MTALSMAVPAVLAPAVAEPLGFEVQQVGLLVSIAYLMAMASGLLCASLSPRYGPVRLSQAALLVTALAMLCYLSGSGWLLLLGAVCIGIGYGIPNPTAAEILSRHAPLDRRGVFFSIKQTGVPVGIALAGAVLPILLLSLGWRLALVVLLIVLVVAALAVGATQRVLEPSRPSRPVEGTVPSASSAATGWRSMIVDRFVVPVRWVLSIPALRRLSLSAITFAFTQIAFLNFVVSLLKLEHGLSLAAAAGMLSTSQVLSVFARIFWGHAADRWIDPGKLLGVLGVLMGVCAALLGLAPHGASPVLLLALALGCAATAVAWNGVYYADLVRHVEPGEVGKATAGTQTLTFFGGVIGATVFAAVVSLAGSYAAAFALCAALPLLAGIALLRAHRRISAAN
jgi:MFS family permease